jgi:hypothetical protein
MMMMMMIIIIIIIHSFDFVNNLGFQFNFVNQITFGDGFFWEFFHKSQNSEFFFPTFWCCVIG